jgi:hypothetical protein
MLLDETTIAGATLEAPGTGQAESPSPAVSPLGALKRRRAELRDEYSRLDSRRERLAEAQDRQQSLIAALAACGGAENRDMQEWASQGAVGPMPEPRTEERANGAIARARIGLCHGLCGCCGDYWH